MVRIRLGTRGRGAAVAAAVLSMLLVVAGCGAGGSRDDDASPSGTPSTIVSISPTTTEMLFAVGAGEQVVAVDDQSDFPAEAPRTTLSGYTPNLEAILAYDPDLVVLTDDNNDIIAGLDRVGVEVLQIPAAKNLDETYAQIQQVGGATGHAREADELVTSMRAEIEQIVRTVPLREVPLTYFHELDDTYYTVTDDTYLGQIYGLLGLRSIATGQNGYPQLSPEYILERDPEVIFLADSQCCGVTPEKVAARAGWGDLRAVKDRQIHVLDEDVASRWGPRVVDLVRNVAQIVSGVDGQPTN
ncbi:putative ABC transporter substrate-binding protein [Gordonia namibiensis NBRC 108229]|uniref:Putative ABC transporter substrate-binding protein n=1 Tax=Gordonia namibiensis NBRC 108229 TaxID=1208314 RepID=K6X3K1_9ACTN|nr:MULTISPECIES: ABC transporter substrate-binding protein [Gordonia]MCK8613380.1 ABC transporter substrate-binding protein [Gordonia sp. C13]GAB98942.1 putative ABC transporter substrate-binding protein [Gordonia namibiensis NBRC 108229]